jgi:large subunit ribosomal protein L21
MAATGTADARRTAHNAAAAPAPVVAAAPAKPKRAAKAAVAQE